MLKLCQCANAWICLLVFLSSLPSSPTLTVVSQGQWVELQLWLLPCTIPSYKLDTPAVITIMIQINSWVCSCDGLDWTDRITSSEGGWGGLDRTKRERSSIQLSLQDTADRQEREKWQNVHYNQVLQLQGALNQRKMKGVIDQCHLEQMKWIYICQN